MGTERINIPALSLDLCVFTIPPSLLPFLSQSWPVCFHYTVCFFLSLSLSLISLSLCLCVFTIPSLPPSLPLSLSFFSFFVFLSFLFIFFYFSFFSDKVWLCHPGRVPWLNLGSQQPLPPGLKPSSSHLNLPNSWDYRTSPVFL